MLGSYIKNQVVSVHVYKLVILEMCVNPWND